MYSPPSVSESYLNDLLSSMCETFISNDNLCLVFGDLNRNMLQTNVLYDLCEIYGLRNLVKGPTCFKSSTNPTQIDGFLTNMPRCFVDTFNVDLGSSDFHNCVGIAARLHAPPQTRRKIVYRSMKNFSEEAYQIDIKYAPFHVAEIFEDPDDKYWFHNKLVTSVIEKHASLKTRIFKKPYTIYEQ